MYNDFKSYHDIAVNEMFEQKIIIIKPTILKDKTPAQWYSALFSCLHSIRNQLVEQLFKSENQVTQEWGQMIKGFCHTFSKVMQVLSLWRMII